MSLINRLRHVIDGSLDAVNDLARRSARLQRWQRERFFAQASRFVPVIAVDVGAGKRYFLRSDYDLIGRQIIACGGFETKTIDTVLGVLRERGVKIDQVLDVGANIGTTTVELLSRLPDATCVAFEPEPRNFEMLEHNIIANGLQHRVTAYRVALSDTVGMLEFELSDASPGDHRVRIAPGSVVDRFDEAKRATIQVPSRTLDDLVGSGDIVVSPNTLVYMDVQGHEGQVLAGARAALANVSAVAMEYWPYGLKRAQGSHLVSDLLQSYACLIDVTDEPREIRVVDLPTIAECLLENQTWIELLAIRPGPASETARTVHGGHGTETIR